MQQTQGVHEHRQNCFPHPMTGFKHTESKFKCTRCYSVLKNLLKGETLVKFEWHTDRCWSISLPSKNAAHGSGVEERKYVREK